MVLFLTIIFGLLSIVYGVKTSQELLAADAGSQKMQEISAAIAEGAYANAGGNAAKAGGAAAK